MNRMFSLDDIADHFWSPSPAADAGESSSGSNNKSTPAMINRSMSEWQFQCFLQDASAQREPSSSRPNDVVEIKDQDEVELNNQSVATALKNTESGRTTATTAYGASVTAGPPIDSEEYQAFLKSRLDLACAAVALTRASSVKTQDLAALQDNGSHASDTSQLGYQTPKVSRIDPVGASKDGGGPVGIPSLPVIQKNTAIPVKSATSGSSRELSDDDELDGDTETTQNADPTDVKRVRRMQSNRESARRSRGRKQAQMTELETQVSQSRIENSSLLKRLTYINQKYNEAAVDNRVLKADVETMRAKVKMAEESVKRITGFNPVVQPVSGLSTLPFYPCTAVPVQHSCPGQPSTNHQVTGMTQHTMVNLPPVVNDQQPNPVEVDVQKMDGTACGTQRGGEPWQ